MTIPSKLEEYENKIIEFFIENGALKGANENLSRVFGYFTTRGTLTQSKIQELAGTSAGTTSKILQLLLSIGIIQINRKPGSRENFYELLDIEDQIINSVESMFNEYFRSRQNFLKRIERQFNKINNEIEDLRKEGYTEQLESNGILDKYKRIKNFITDFKKIIPIFEKGAKLFTEV